MKVIIANRVLRVQISFKTIQKDMQCSKYRTGKLNPNEYNDCWGNGHFLCEKCTYYEEPIDY